MKSLFDFIIRKLKITFCFIFLLVTDMALAVAIFILIYFLSILYKWLGGPTNVLYIFITQLSGIASIILYIIFSLFTIITSITLLRDYLQ